MPRLITVLTQLNKSDLMCTGSRREAQNLCTLMLSRRYSRLQLCHGFLHLYTYSSMRNLLIYFVDIPGYFFECF